jgi:hypothetical protein
MARVKDLDRLHPAMKAKVEAMMDDLSSSPHNWRVYETWRKPATKKSTSSTSQTDPNKNPSRHGYGAAVDVVPNGTWGPKGTPWRKASWPGWAELRKAAHKAGLDNDISWDRPHVEVKRTQITKWLQQAIGVKDDGKYGPATDTAAKVFAQSHGIEWLHPVPTASPKVHPTTYNEIMNASDKTWQGAGIAGGSVALVAAIAAWWIWRGKS